MKRDYCWNNILNFLETIVYLCFYQKEEALAFSTCITSCTVLLLSVFCFVSEIRKNIRASKTNTGNLAYFCLYAICFSAALSR